MEDEKIIGLYWERNEDAITETSSKYGKLFFRIASNILLNHEDSEECVNDTYLGQYRTTATIRITGRPFCKNQLGRPCFCSQERTDSSCQAGSVSQNQIR